jgi:hypothetical protein
MIEPATGGDPVAWLPAALEHLTTHPSGRIWAGSVGDHLYLIQLEGERLSDDAPDAHATRLHSASGKEQGD